MKVCDKCGAVGGYHYGGCAYTNLQPFPAPTVIHVHHDTEAHARSYNEGYEAAVTQGLADDPTLAGDWFDGKIREAAAKALEGAADGWQVRMDTLGRGSTEALDWLHARAVAVRGEG